MYLGRDVLSLNGQLRPVQWTSYVDGMRAYQGSLSKRDKTQTQEAFRAKANRALSDPVAAAVQDWEGMRLIVSTILTAFGG